MVRPAAVLTALGSLALLFSSCGKSSSPTAPSPTVTGVTVTVSSPLRMGQTTQASGTQTQSNGQTQAITSGWLSDAPGVATVSGTGLVTGVSNGRATIYVVAGGRQGQQVIRVVPDYHGRWSGRLSVTTCTHSGIFAELGFCDDFASGTSSGYLLDLSQTGEQMTAALSYGPSLVFPVVQAPVREDGTSAFTPSVSVNDSGITLIIDATATINSASVGQLTGTVNETWRFPNVAGEGRLMQQIVATSRSGSGVQTIDPGARSRSFHRLLERIRR